MSNKPKMAYSREVLWIEITVILNWRYRLEICYDLVWFGMVGMVWYGLVWFGMVWYGLVWFGMLEEDLQDI